MGALTEQWESQARTAYLQQQYQEAAAFYLKLDEAYPNTLDIMYNLGNVYYQLQDKGRALGYYLRVLEADPNDADSLYNREVLYRELDLHRTKKETALSLLVTWVQSQSLLVMLALSLGCGAMALTGIALGQRFSRIRAWLPGVYGCLFLIWVGATGGVALKQYTQLHDTVAVCLPGKQPVYSGPSTHFPVLFHVHQGETSRQLTSRDGWSEVVLPNGFRGWVPSEALFLL